MTYLRIASKSMEEHFDHNYSSSVTNLSEVGLRLRHGKCRGQVRQYKNGSCSRIPATQISTRYLGIVNFYQSHTRELGIFARLLTELTRTSRTVPFQWSEACQGAFKEIKKYLSTEPVLRPPDFAKPFLYG